MEGNILKEIAHTHVQTGALASINATVLIMPSALNLHSCIICSDCII